MKYNAKTQNRFSFSGGWVMILVASLKKNTTTTTEYL